MEIKFNFDRKNVQIGFQNQFIIENFTNNLLVKILPGRGPKGDSYVLEEEDKQEIADIVSQQANTELEKYKTIYNVLPKVSVEGTDIELKDTGNAMLAFNSFNGYTSQKTTTGKNLFDKDNQVKVQVNSGGTLRYGIIVDAPNKKVSISAKSWNNSIALKPLINGSYGDFLNINSNTTLDVVDKLIIYATSDTDKLDLNIEELQVEINDVPTDYEPYTGGIASPNPNYPQAIKVVTGNNIITIRGKNLFDYKKHSALALNSSGRITTTNYVNKDNTVIYKLKPNTKYIFSFRNKNMAFSNVGLSMVLNGTWVQTNTGKYIVQTDSKGEFTAKIGAQSYPNIGAAAAYIQLEEGTSVTPYTPHQSQAYPISLGDIELARKNDYKDYIFKNVVGSPYYNANLDLNEWYLHKEIVGKNLWEMPWFYNDEYTTPVPRTVLRLANMISQSGYFSNCFLSSEMNDQQIVNRLKTDSGNWYIALADSLTGIETTDSSGTKLNKIITYLQSVSANIYYGLATPTNTKITDTTLIQQLENINNNARSCKDTTYIICSSESEDNETIQASLTALKDISTLFEQVNNAIIEIGGGE